MKKSLRFVLITLTCGFAVVGLGKGARAISYRCPSAVDFYNGVLATKAFNSIPKIENKMAVPVPVVSTDDSRFFQYAWMVSHVLNSKVTHPYVSGNFIADSIYTPLRQAGIFKLKIYTENSPNNLPEEGVVLATKAYSPSNWEYIHCIYLLQSTKPNEYSSYAFDYQPRLGDGYYFEKSPYIGWTLGTDDISTCDSTRYSCAVDIVKGVA